MGWIWKLDTINQGISNTGLAPRTDLVLDYYEHRAFRQTLDKETLEEENVKPLPFSPCGAWKAHNLDLIQQGIQSAEEHLHF